MRIRKLIVFTLLAILLVSAMACGGGGQATATPPPMATLTPTPTAPAPTPTPSPTPIPGYLVYRDSANGFAISYPQTWEIGPDWAEGGPVVAFWDPMPTGFGMVVEVYREELADPMSVGTYFEQSKQWLLTIKEYTAISEEELTVSGRAAMKHVFTWMTEHSQKAMLVFLVDGATGWLIRCNSLTDAWSQYEAKFEALVGSFRLD